MKKAASFSCHPLSPPLRPSGINLTLSYALKSIRFYMYFFYFIRICICCFRYGYASIEKQRQRLPVYKYRTAILYLVETHAATIIVGETGSGKTTQIPQVFLFLINFLFKLFIYFFFSSF